MVVIGGTLKNLRRYHSLGIDITFVQSAEKVRPSSMDYCTEILRADFVNDYDTVERLLLERHLHHPFQRILSVSEEGLVPAARLSRLLGLGGNPLHAVWRLKDKHLMRRCLEEKGLSPVRYGIADSAESLKLIARAFGGKVVVKPVCGSGSAGVLHMAHPDEADTVWSETLQSGHGLMLVEEHLDGPEFSVETFSWKGQHLVLAVTRKLLHHNIEVGHSMPAELGSRRNEEVAVTAKGLLDAVGIVEGPAHTEIRITKDGPRIIESQNRVGGSRIDELLAISLGMDIHRLAISVPLGIDPPPVFSPVSPRGAAVRHFVPKPGRVVDVHVPDTVAADQSLSLVLGVEPGDVVHEQRTNFDRNALGCWVVAGGSDEDEAIHRCQRVLDSVEIVTEAMATLPGRGPS
ncbi:ATP-grasp domain-containing protein [Streptomyces sp. DG2A-72]|uniref:ATP-grasp domain-containing protein n=1 Tax=Streptomyces sp. DG2A-72 TaxID=3051386 RepID=UPI00265C0861|nr:ATP-grasp domain-containing protein [Streptomyces sp. DG2A-72]MDO0933579.1 ATP-grasp domain-containing protein [Streptomyces sp. DG2A-72]